MKLSNLLRRPVGLFAAALAVLSITFAPVVASAADLSVTAANVIAGSTGRVDRTAVAGEAITQGQAVYKASVSQKWMKADADSATAEARQASGIALNGASLNQPLAVQTGGSITIGATLTAAAPYYLSGTAGGVAPAADLSTGEYVDLICLATSTSVCALQFAYTGVVTP
jgi:hypothetical protein